METIDLVPLIEALDDNIDDLEEALEPLLKNALSDATGKLPLLDKAQLYVLITYAIESILFSYLRLNGVNSKEHPVFRELTRVKQYFEKIKAAESAGTKQNVTVDKAAAGRFIKHALAGNKKLDLDLATQKGIGNKSSHTRFDGFYSKRTFSNGRAVSSSDDPDSNPEQLGHHDGPSSKSMKGQSPYDRRGSDDGTEARTKYELNPSSEMASKTNPTNSDSKAERKKKKLSKKRKLLEESRVILDGE